MTLFDKLVETALENQPQWVPLRVVVEKELLHHDILSILSQHGLLESLTFIGGTCLRCCYGGVRLSEDLDFTGGADFTRERLSTMAGILIENLSHKYGLQVKVSEPEKDKKNVDTWKIKVETRPEQKHLPAQRINIDICAVPSYDVKPMLLQNHYGVDMGTTGLIIQAQSREEIYTDKLLAFAFRPNRLKYRDLWDIAWLHQQGIKPNLALVLPKLNDRNYAMSEFLERFHARQALVKTDTKLAAAFKQEMQRFLFADDVNRALEQNQLWEAIAHLLDDLERQLTELI